MTPEIVAVVVLVAVVAAGALAFNRRKIKNPPPHAPVAGSTRDLDRKRTDKK